MTHSWNLFEVAIISRGTTIQVNNGALILGLEELFEALNKSAQQALKDMASDDEIKKSCLLRYSELRKTAKS